MTPPRRRRAWMSSTAATIRITTTTTTINQMSQDMVVCYPRLTWSQPGHWSLRRAIAVDQATRRPACCSITRR